MSDANRRPGGLSVPDLGPDGRSPRDTIATGAAEGPASDPDLLAASPVSPEAGTAHEPANIRGISSSRVSVPPPSLGSRASLGQIDLGDARPARLPLVVAAALGLLLIALPLYLWRRPRAESIASGITEPAPEAPPPAPAPSFPDDAPVLSEPRTLSCHDPGPRKTPAEQCDRLPDVEAALTSAVRDAASCVPSDAGGGTIQFVADVSFKRRSIGVSTPKDGRTLKSGKVALACQAAVKAKLGGANLAGMTHAHTRYRIAVTATYPGPVR